MPAGGNGGIHFKLKIESEKLKMIVFRLALPADGLNFSF